MFPNFLGRTHWVNVATGQRHLVLMFANPGYKHPGEPAVNDILYVEVPNR